MSEPKPFASLSSGLLARKGQAKPAMRPQGFGTFGTQSTGFDDLGWNDMGHDRVATPVALSPMEAEVVPLHADIEQDVDATEPVVLQQREEIERSFEPAPVETTEPNKPILMEKRKAVPAPSSEPVAEVVSPPKIAVPMLPVIRAAPGSKARAAFTLRLDADRHLQLRLASAVAHRSAQALMIDALDAFLATQDARS